MLELASGTGLTGTSREPRRYLWTDAFAVCNFLELHRQTRQQHFLDLALKLVDEVHQTLGRQHPDSGRSGWISGLSDADAARHPTLGGLRIGKKLNERQPDEPFDESLEWDRDGQYSQQPGGVSTFTHFVSSAPGTCLLLGRCENDSMPEGAACLRSCMPV